MPYYAALSTDVKKSSVLWNNHGEWMFYAIQRLNSITEFINDAYRRKAEVEGKKITHMILPNSPEGDAYTIYFTGEKQLELKEHVRHMAHCLQRALELARETPRNKEDPAETILGTKCKGGKKKNIGKYAACMKPWERKIFLRIGVAFSDEPPTEYTYMISKGILQTKLISYRGGVIDDSERAEAGAGGFRLSVAFTQKEDEQIIDEKTEKKLGRQKMKAIGEEEDNYIYEAAIQTEVYKNDMFVRQNVNGYIVFIHFHFNIDVKDNPYLYKAMKREFTDIHQQTLQYFRDSVRYENQNTEVKVVKVKRSAEAMLYIGPIDDKKEYIKPSSLWNVSLALTAQLPHGSSIGICYLNEAKQGKQISKLNRIIPTKEPTYKYDYFGEAVNLAARMCKTSWTYDKGGLFKTLENNHACRVAICAANNDGDTNGWSGWTEGRYGKFGSNKLKEFNTPYEIEDIPKSALNAGREEDRLRVLSAHVTLGDVIHIGDKVTFEEKSKKVQNKVETINAEVIDLDILRALVRREDNNEKKWISLTKLKKIKQEFLEPISVLLEKSSKASINSSLKF